MPTDRKTGSAIPAGILQPTTRPEPPTRIEPTLPADEGQGGQSPVAEGEPTTQETKAPRRRTKKAAANEKLEGRRLYLSEGVHFRLRMLAYTKRKNISEVAEEVLDKNLPRYDVNRTG
jgi:hypothetical protein